MNPRTVVVAALVSLSCAQGSLDVGPIYGPDAGPGEAPTLARGADSGTGDTGSSPGLHDAAFEADSTFHDANGDDADTGALDDASDAEGGADVVVPVPLTMPDASAVMTVESQVGAAALAVDGTRLYWLAGNDVMVVPLAGGAPETLATVVDGAAAAPFADVIAVDDTTVYFSSSTALSGELLSVPKGGGTLTTLASQEPSSLAYDSDNLYWVATDGVYTMPKSGGAVVTLTGGLPSQIAVDATNVYFSDNEDGTILSVPKTGGSVVTLVKQGYPEGITVVGPTLYWVDALRGGVESVPTAGGATSTLSSLGTAQGALQIVSDATALYWAGCGDPPCTNYVMSQPVSGGSAVPLAYVEEQVYSLAISPTQVYWIYSGVGSTPSSILSVAR